MSDPSQQWLVVAKGETAEDVLPHVAGRVATVLRKQTDQFLGARAHGGNIVLAATHRSCLVTAVCGRDPSGEQIGVRISVAGRGDALLGLVTFALASSAIFTAAILRLPRDVAPIVGFVVGAAGGAVLAYLVYRVSLLLGVGSRLLRARQVAVLNELCADFQATIDGETLRLVSTDLTLRGYDPGTEVAHDPRWFELTETALRSIG